MIEQDKFRLPCVMHQDYVCPMLTDGSVESFQA